MSHNNNNDDEDTANAAAAADDDDDGLDHHSRNIKINVASFGRLVHLLASASPDIYTHQRRIACMEDANKAVIQSVECREYLATHCQGKIFDWIFHQWNNSSVLTVHGFNTTPPLAVVLKKKSCWLKELLGERI